jgi:hypothetical protein
MAGVPPVPFPAPAVLASPATPTGAAVLPAPGAVPESGDPQEMPTASSGKAMHERVVRREDMATEHNKGLRTPIDFGVLLGRMNGLVPRLFYAERRIIS